MDAALLLPPMPPFTKMCFAENGTFFAAAVIVGMLPPKDVESWGRDEGVGWFAQGHARGVWGKRSMVIQFGGRALLTVCGYPLRLPSPIAPKLRVSARWGTQGRCGFPSGGASAAGGRMLVNDNAALPHLWG